MRGFWFGVFPAGYVILSFVAVTIDARRTAVLGFLCSVRGSVYLAGGWWLLGSFLGRMIMSCGFGVSVCGGVYWCLWWVSLWCCVG